MRSKVYFAAARAGVTQRSPSLAAEIAVVIAMEIAEIKVAEHSFRAVSSVV